MGERHRERWRERQTDGQRWRETESERDRDRERKRNRWKTDTERDRETDRDGERQRQGLRAYRETDTVGWGAELSRRVGRGGGCPEGGAPGREGERGPWEALGWKGTAFLGSRVC